MKYNEPEIKVKISKESLNEFTKYLALCSAYAFIGYENKVQENLILYSLNSVREKTAHLLYKNFNEVNTKPVSFKLNKAERIALSVLFSRINIPASIVHCEYQILKTLHYEKIQNTNSRI